MGVRVLYSLTVHTLAAYLELHFRQLDLTVTPQIGSGGWNRTISTKSYSCTKHASRLLYRRESNPIYFTRPTIILSIRESTSRIHFTVYGCTYTDLTNALTNWFRRLDSNQNTHAVHDTSTYTGIYCQGFHLTPSVFIVTQISSGLAVVAGADLRHKALIRRRRACLFA